MGKVDPLLYIGSVSDPTETGCIMFSAYNKVRIFRFHSLTAKVSWALWHILHELLKATLSFRIFINFANVVFSPLHMQFSTEKEQTKTSHKVHFNTEKLIKHKSISWSSKQLARTLFNNIFLKENFIDCSKSVAYTMFWNFPSRINCF